LLCLASFRIYSASAEIFLRINLKIIKSPSIAPRPPMRAT
jgi:hypothetical protein